MFCGQTREQTAFEVKMHEINYSELLAVIEYCYTDETIISETSAVDLLLIAHKYW